MGRFLCLLLLFALFVPGALAEQSTLEIKLDDPAAGGLSSGAVRIVVMLTLLSVAPAILLLMTSFVRLIIAFHFLRQAMGTPQVPPNQVLIGLALFLSFFIMSPVIDQVNKAAWTPYEDGELSAMEAVDAASGPFKDFMLRNTRQEDLKLFIGMARIERPKTRQDLPMKVVVPSFVISELRAGFEIGFLLFLPFIVVDLVVASVLLSMGMMMLPPAMISLPFKIMLFVMVDGWSLVTGSLVAGFH